MASLLILVGEIDPRPALERALSTAGARTAPGPPELRALLHAQLGAAKPLDAYAWSALAGGAAIRFLPGGDGGLEPALARALSDVTGGLVLMLEALRTRDRYTVGSFISGRTVQLDRCIEGVVSGRAGHELCDDDVVSAVFAAWLPPLLGPATPPVHRLGDAPTGGLLATPAHSEDAVETPLARLALRDADANIKVHERKGELDPSQLRRLGHGHSAAGLGLIGGGAPTRWALLAEDGSLDEGVAAGQEELGAALPAWALAAPKTRATDAA